MTDRRLGLGHPAALLATWFGAGLLPDAPGTWGSAAALPCGLLLWWLGGPPVLLAGAAIVTALGWWAAARYVRLTRTKDPGEIVIDEVAGQWLAMLPAAGDPTALLASFLLFRAFDIVKPFPANWCDRRVPGGLGVMLDDLVAGAYAALALWLGQRLLLGG